MMEAWRVLVSLGLVLLSVAPSEEQSCGAHLPGVPGVPGIPGPDGRDGTDGGKGDAGSLGLLIGWKKEEYRGAPGKPGNPGKVGPKGPVGPPGSPGQLGEKGMKGDFGEYKTEVHAAFSMRRMASGFPRPDQPVRFDQTIVNINNQYEAASGKFSCHYPGIYYFTYHTTSRGPLCLKIMRAPLGGAPEKVLMLCDHVHNIFQVTTGGLVLEVLKGDSVWLETTKLNNLLRVEGADSIFTGFLLFPLS